MTINTALYHDDLLATHDSIFKETKKKILDYFEGKEKVTLLELIKEVGFSRYRAVLVVVHELVMKKQLDGKSPYDEKVLELDKHILRKVKNGQPNKC